MTKISARGTAIFNIVAALLVLLAVWLFVRPYYEHYKMKKAFSNVMLSGNALYGSAQTYYIKNHRWPTSASDLRDYVGNQLISDWVIGNKVYSCEIAYGRGDHSVSDIQCVSKGKYAKAMLYQLLLSEKQLDSRYCWASKNNKIANKICEEIGGVASHITAGSTVPYQVYRLP